MSDLFVITIKFEISFYHIFSFAATTAWSPSGMSIVLFLLMVIFIYKA